MHKLIVHIGTGKTGSTSIQKWLRENKSFLNQSGYHYFDSESENIPSMRRRFRMVGPLELALVNVPYLILAYPELWSRKEKRDVIKLINKQLLNYDVIISDELIWECYGKTPYELLDRLKRAFNVPIEVIVYFRREDLYMRSRVEHIKKALICETISETKEDIYDLLKKIEDVVGTENLVVRTFEKEQLKNQDVVSDFLSILGLQFESNVNTRVNEKLQEELLALKEIFNEEYLSSGGEPSLWIEQECCKCFEKLNEMPFNTFENMTYSIEKCEDYNLYLNQREDQYEKIAREYLNNQEGVFFTKSDINSYESKIVISKREEEIVRVFARLLAELENDDIKMHRKYDFLYRIKQYPIYGLISFLFLKNKNHKILIKYRSEVLGDKNIKS